VDGQGRLKVRKGSGRVGGYVGRSLVEFEGNSAHAQVGAGRGLSWVTINQLSDGGMLKKLSKEIGGVFSSLHRVMESKRVSCIVPKKME